MPSHRLACTCHRGTTTSQAALEGGDAADIAATLRRLRLDRLRDEAEEARQIAERRSGERGLAARQALVAAEAHMAAAEQELEAPVGPQELHRALEVAQVRRLGSRLGSAGAAACACCS